MKDQNNSIPTEQVYGMFEEIKEIIEKRPIVHATGGETGNNDAVLQKLKENTDVIDRHAGQVTALVNRLGQIDFHPNIRVQPPDMKDINDAFEQIKVNYSGMAGNLNQIRTEIKTALSDEKIERTAQRIVGQDANQYKTMLYDHWRSIYRLLEHLENRIPYKYDINKRFVKWLI